MFICFASSANEVVIREAVVIAAALACRSMPPRQPTGLTRGGGFVKSDNYLIACTCKLPLVFCLISCVVTLTCRFLSLSFFLRLSCPDLAFRRREQQERVAVATLAKQVTRIGAWILGSSSDFGVRLLSSKQPPGHMPLSLLLLMHVSLSLSLSLSAESLVPQPRQLV